MPSGLESLKVLTPAIRGPRASSWRGRLSTQPRLYCNAQHRTSYSSIADAMLGRAAKNFETSTSRHDLAKQLFPSSSPAQDGNIGDQFQKARAQTSTSFTNYKNNANPLSARSPNTADPFRRTTSASSGLGDFLSRENSFRESPVMVDPPREPTHVKPSSASTWNSCGFVEFDENDFDDDAELDLDYDIPSVLPMAAPPRPQGSALTVSTPRRINTHNFSAKPASQAPGSSAVTWSSSSPSNRTTPPAAAARRQRDQLASQPPTSTMDDTDPNPRPTKRRTLPWAQQKADSDQLAARQEELDEQLAVEAASDSSQPAMCFKCQKRGHYARDCPSKGSSVWTRTPHTKEKSMPWNTTASALKEQKSRRKRTLTKSDQVVGMEAMDSARRKTPAQMFAPINLSAEQLTVRDLVVSQNKSVFFTGSAGTGKSVLMKSIITELRKKFIREPDRVAITASTGLAACNIGGVTLHSFGGIGLGKEDVPTLVKKIKRNAKAKQRWLRTKILIIDEISMVDGELFDKLEGIARAMRNNGRPFGGIQLVITGDFFQLPPVPDYDSKARGVKFAFDAATWSTAIHHTIGLTEVFRQKDPGAYRPLVHIYTVLTYVQFLPTCLMSCVLARSPRKLSELSRN